MLLPDLPTPAVIVRREILVRNIQRMATAAAAAGVHLRPHAKTHKCLEIALMQRKAGAVGLTVAKLGEAEVLLAAGPDSILVANQIVGADKVARLIHLNQRLPVISAVDGVAGARFLNDHAATADCILPVAIEVDSGLNRAGVAPGEPALALAREVVRLPHLSLWGLFTHAGHAYAAAGPAEVAGIGRLEGELLTATAALLRAAGIAVANVSAGSTPTALHAARVHGVTEIRPGNYVFHDAMQVALGVATEADCALRVVATVISRPAPERAVLDCGSKTLAMDRGAHGTGALPGHGLVLGPHRRMLARLSEEHGVLSLDPTDPLAIGTRLEIIPNHACVVANLTEWLTLVEGNVPVTRWRVAARGCST